MRKSLKKRRKEFDSKWDYLRKGLWVAIWTPSDCIEGKFKNLDPEHLPKLVKVNLKAEYWISNKRPPLYNKQIG